MEMKREADLIAITCAYACGNISLGDITRGDFSQEEKLFMFDFSPDLFKKKLGKKSFSWIYLRECDNITAGVVLNYLKNGLRRRTLLDALEEYIPSYCYNPGDVSVKILKICRVLRKFKIPVRKIEAILNKIDPYGSSFFFCMVTKHANEWRAIGIDPKKYAAWSVLWPKFGERIPLDTADIPVDVLRQLRYCWRIREFIDKAVNR